MKEDCSNKTRYPNCQENAPLSQDLVAYTKQENTESKV